MQSGIGGTGIVTDLSSGMVSVAVRNGKGLGLNVTGLVADAERLPFVDSSVDLVVGPCGFTPCSRSGRAIFPR